MMGNRHGHTSTIGYSDNFQRTLTLTGDFVVDTNTLYVDSANNRVGILTLAPLSALDVNGSALIQGDLTITTTTGALLLPRMTTAQQDALTPINGMLIYNSQTNKFRGYENGVWTNLI